MLPLVITNGKMTLVDGKELKTRRETLGMTQGDLADLMGVTTPAISRWEAGKRRLPKMAVLLLAYIEEKLTKRHARSGRANNERKRPVK